MASDHVVFDRLVILGIGLMGSSLALAAKKAGSVKHVVGWSRRESTRERALELGVVDSICDDIEQALQGASCVVVATPTQLAESVMIDVLERVGPEVAVTDVASVKGNLESALLRHFGSVPDNAVLGHPIAGSEKSGVDAGFADLYLKQNVILIQSSTGAVSPAFDQVKALWQSVGANVFSMSCSDHDRILALTSHLPHLLAFALVTQLSRADNNDDILRFAAGGFRDFTRIAASDPIMWREIFFANRDQLLESIEHFEEVLASMRAQINADETDKLEAALADAKQSRDVFGQRLLARRRGDSE